MPKQASPTSSRMHRSVPNSSIGKPAVSRPHVFILILRYQIEISLALIFAILFLHQSSPSRHYTQKLLYLSYPTPSLQSYKQGFDDVYFIVGWIVNFTALRAVSIEWILRPIASHLGVPRKSHLRFAEQGWLVVYYSIFWTLGMYLWVNSTYWLNSQAIWSEWPSREMSATFKWYYLVQLAFWIQQILVIHIEARRKDHMQMLTHHIITCTLISVAYVYRYTRVGNVILCLMDVVDLLLPIAKILRYLRQEVACNAAFGLFVATWFIARHVLYLKLCYSIYTDVPGPNTMFYGCYSGETSEVLVDIPAQPDYFSHILWPFYDLNGPICLNFEVKWIFLTMLVLLQSLSMIWFIMILKVIAGILMGGQVEDSRSDDEEEAESDKLGRRRPIDVTELGICVGGRGSDDINRGVITLSLPPKVPGSRRRLINAEAKKELLGRIGCEKP